MASRELICWGRAFNYCTHLSSHNHAVPSGSCLRPDGREQALGWVTHNITLKAVGQGELRLQNARLCDPCPFLGDQKQRSKILWVMLEVA